MPNLILRPQAFLRAALSSSSTSLRPLICARLLTDTIMSADSGKDGLLSLKNSRKSLFALFRATAPPVFELTERPSRLVPSSLGRRYMVKLLVESLFPSLRTFTNSSGLRSRSSFEKEKSFFDCPLFIDKRPDLSMPFIKPVLWRVEAILLF